MRVEQDNRTLREFYPDPDQRHQAHYAFAHRFLPGYVQQNPFAFFTYLYDDQAGKIDPTRFIHSRWSAIFEPWAGLTPEPGPELGRMLLRCVRDLSMALEELDGRASALVQMPEPELSPEAYFVAVVLLAPASDAGAWAPDVQARVFTLEAEVSENSRGKTGVLCEWSETEHINFGLRVPAERRSFLHAVSTLLRSPDARPPAP